MLVDGRERTSCSQLRAMQYSDLEDIVRIECAAHITPWSKATLRDCIRAGYDCELISIGGECVAFSIARTGPDDTELLNLCVHPDHQQRGLGRRLLGSVVTRARRLGSARVLLDVRESNGPAQTLYAKSGFECLGQRPGYYRQANGERESAVIMALMLV